MAYLTKKGERYYICESYKSLNLTIKACQLKTAITKQSNPSFNTVISLAHNLGKDVRLSVVK